jgi:energy-coupling factor transporter transmembrane protein EcfT
MALGPIASLDPACRLLCLALFSTTSLIAPWPFAACLALASFVFLLVGGLKSVAILKESAFVLVFAIATFGLRLWGQEEGENWRSISFDAAVYGIKLLSAFLSGRLFYASTKVSELREALLGLSRRMPFLKSSCASLGLGISLVIAYLPLILEQWRASVEAASSRAFPKKPSLSQARVLLSSYLRRLMLEAVSLPEALYARGLSEERYPLEASWRTRDRVCAALSILFLVITLLYDVCNSIR